MGNFKGKENSLLFLGETRVGKSSMIKLLTKKDPKIEVSNLSTTLKTNCYEGKINETDFVCIDTRGFSDPIQNDETNISIIKELIGKNELKIKQIIIVINFEAQAITNNFINIIKNIVSIFPMLDFWDHVLLCYSHYRDESSGGYTADVKRKMLEESNIKGFKMINEQLKKEYNIKEVEYPKIKKIYVNIQYPEDSEIKKELNNSGYKSFKEELIKIFEQKIPIYHKAISRTEIIEYADVSKNNDEFAIYEANIQIIEFKDINNKIIAESRKIVGDKVFIRTEKKSYYEKFRTGGIISIIIGGITTGIGVGLFLLPGGALISIPAFATIASIGGGTTLAGTGFTIGMNYKDNALKNEIEQKCSKRKEIEDILD